MKLSILKGILRNKPALLLCVSGVISISVVAGPQKATNVASAYLPKSGPALLRFAPIQPAIAKLPPLPPYRDPELNPVSSNAPITKPAIPQETQTKPTLPAVPPMQRPKSEEYAASSSVSTNQPPFNQSASESALMNPQLFLRYFPNGRPAGAGVYFADPISFQVPIREPRLSSSASYEVR